MRIYKMTATFGKLEQETLTLEPGLNIITAPNEWGKSTWCAFLVAMLYGLDTRAKTTKNNLADKERYVPWSGSPMAGRIDLNWNGRDITIERRTKRRVPLGEFQAYETESGLPVDELTASNCGQMLLGVEQTVFRRAGFIRQADLPVTQDEALRRRLNALVTTGDDSGAADRLASELKDLKNRCRYNRSGLLPQAEAKRKELEEKIGELEKLDGQIRTLKERLESLKDWIRQLKNHQQAMAYAQMETDANRVAQAGTVLEQAEQELRHMEEVCASLPAREEVERKARELRTFRDQWNAAQIQFQQTPGEPVKPQLLPPFSGMTEEEARAMVKEDAKSYAQITTSKLPMLLIIIALAGFLVAGVLAVLKAYLFAIISGSVAVVALVWNLLEGRSMKRQRASLLEKYGNEDHRHWIDPVEQYAESLATYREEWKQYQQSSSDLDVRMMVLRKKRDTLCGFQEPEVLLEHCQQAVSHWDHWETARREAQRAKEHYDSLRSMLRPVEKPTQPDTLTQSPEDSASLLAECSGELQRLQNRLGQYQGRMEALGNREALLEQLKDTNQRIHRLEDTYLALTIAQETLSQARLELQRRFAPRITKKAQQMLSRMTDGRYHSLTMSEDFSLQAGAGQEETLHDAIWRSDGTMDQLYLALRLVVAEELTPEAPLILDDALVRFDDQRMTQTLRILWEMGEHKQIICFTCQGREGNAV